MNKIWRLAHFLYIKCGDTWFVNILSSISCLLFANSISVKANIGEGTVFHHKGVGCVIHDEAVIGKKCNIMQNVTIGQTLSQNDLGGGT